MSRGKPTYEELVKRVLELEKANAEHQRDREMLSEAEEYPRSGIENFAEAGTLPQTMAYTLRDLIDIPKLQALLDTLDEIHSLPSAIIDNDGNILTATAWQDICTKFHRANPETEKKCKESDSYITNELDRNPPHVIYKCPFGLVDTATPIIVQGHHLGNVFTGQLFTEPYDEERFIRQAREYGFDEEAYLEAMRKVPVISEERLRKNLKFLGHFAEMLATQGLIHKRQLETEKALRDSEKRYHDLYDQANEGLCMMTSEGLLFEANQAFAEMHGYTLDEINGMDIRELDVLKERALEERTDIGQRIEAGEVVRFEVEHLRKDGRIFPLSVTASLMRSGGQTYYLTFHQDITERKRAEEALRASERKARAMFNLSFEFIGLLNLDGTLIEANQSALDFAGVPQSEVLGKPFWETSWWTHSPEMQTRLREAVSTAAGGELVRFEATHPAADGSIHYIDFSLRPMKDENGRVVLLIPEGRDITELRRGEQALRESEEKFRKIFEAGPLGMALASPDYRFIKVNQQFCRMTGYTEREFGSMTYADITHPDYLGKDRAAVEKLFKGEIPVYQAEKIYIRKDKKEIWGNLTCTVVRDTRGKPLYSLAIVENITERKKAEKALQESQVFNEALLKSSPDIIYIYDLVEKVNFYSNESIVNVLGYSVAEIKAMAGNLIQQLMHPDDFQIYLNHTIPSYATVKDKEFIEHEYRMRHKNGEWCWFSSKESIFLREKDGSPRQIFGTIRDVTERKKIENNLRESRMQLEEAQHIARIGSWQYEVSLDRVSWTAEMFRIFGADPARGHLSWEEHRQYIHPDDWERVNAVVTAGMREGKDYDIEFRIVHEDKSIVWALSSCRVTRDIRGNVTTLRGTVQDITDRKLSEKTLRESEEKFRNLFDNVEVGMFRTRLDGSEILDMNDKFLEIFGYTREEMRGGPSAIHWSDPGEREEMVRRLKVDGRVTEYECRMLNKRGEVRWCLTSLRLYPKQAILEGSIVDITERKQAAEDLRLSEERHRTILQTALDGFWLVDTQGRLLEVNESYCRMSGYSAQELQAMGIHDLEAIETVEDVAARIRKVKAQGEDRFETRHRRKDESIFDVETSVKFGPSEGGKFMVFLRDITERKRTEEALLESYNRLETILASLEDAILLVGSDSRQIKECNDAASEIFGYSREEMVGRQTDFLHVDQAHFEQFGRESLAAYEYPGYYSTEFEMRRSDGSVFPTEHFVRPLRGPDGRITYVVSLTRDITARKQAEEEKAKLEAQLQQAQKMESVGRLAGGVAHDFNNMLSVILGHAEMALDRLDPDQPVYADMEEIRKAAVRSADLTRQLLAYARRQPVAPKVLDLNETVAGMLKMLKRMIGEDIDLAWLPGADLWAVRVDPTQIDQILANLCVNARDAIVDVGKVTIETGNYAFDAEYCANHTGFRPGEFVLLAVSDNGVGMSKAVLDNIFEPFFTTKRMGEGTGLGLSMVYGAIKQNNGFINVYSEPGKGTIFKIYLPRHEGKTGQASMEGAAESLKRGLETILLVEDEPSILKLTTVMLERQGYTVLTSSTPGEAIRLARENTGVIDMLITDVVMPEMNGRELARNLLSLYPNMKRLFMSGYSANVIAHHGVLDEGVHFIQKPFSIASLTAKVRETLDSD